MTKSLRLAAVLGAAILAMPSPSPAMDANQRSEIEKIVREYLLANPGIILEMRDALEARKRVEQEEKQKLTLAAEKDALYKSANQIAIGAVDAPVTVVEFFDYNCGFCQRALDDMNRLVKAGNVRFILKEFPVLGEESVEAARISIAFNRLMPMKAAEFHRLLLGAPGRKDGKIALEVAKSLGADTAKLKAESEKDDVVAAIQESYRLGDGLAITGTPSYVLGDEVVFGAVGFDALGKKVANLASCGKTLC
jgi:protein-disulfide isomerase